MRSDMSVHAGKEKEAVPPVLNSVIQRILVRQIEVQDSSGSIHGKRTKSSGGLRLISLQIGSHRTCAVASRGSQPETQE